LRTIPILFLAVYPLFGQLFIRTEWAEQTIPLAPGSQFTFLSDGVLEATNAKGELLGFHRLGALTVKPAREIAQAAHAWGQEDDITVVTVRRAG
jgi:serine phosphatase RsbU (regulator of sigma subunit)